jgi:thiamine kinase-like enzyme
MDIKSIFSTLHSHGVKYVLVGALGVVAHGARLETEDVDICIATDSPNLERAAATLREMQARLVREPATRPLSSVDLGDWESLRLDDPSEHHLFATRSGDIVVLPEPFGPGGWGSTTSYMQLARKAVEVKAFDLAIQVAAFEDIRSSKMARDREQDVAAQAESARVGRILARGERPGFGLEQFAARAAGGSGNKAKLLGAELTEGNEAMATDEQANENPAKRFLARMEPQVDHTGGPVVRCEMSGEGISGASICRVLFANLAAILKFTLPANGHIAMERAGRELAFYRHLAGRVPVRVPQLLASYSGPEGIALLLPAYQPSPPPSGWHEADYLEAARQLARLHAAFWGKTQVPASFTWLKRRQPDDTRKDVRNAAGYWQALRDQPRFADVLDGPTFQWIIGLLSRFGAADEIVPELPLTLCHGDFNTTNLLTDAEGLFVWVDWQEVGPAPGPEDLSFFIQRASAEAEVPRRQILAEYCEELRRATGEPISLDAIRQAMEAAELRTYLLYWPEYMTQAEEKRLRDMLERIRSLAS